jgi:hypothetical protein
MDLELIPHPLSSGWKTDGDCFSNKNLTCQIATKNYVHTLLMEYSCNDAQ